MVLMLNSGANPYMQMEYVEGSDWLAVNEVIRLMSDVANGALFGAGFLSVSVITKTGIKRAPKRTVPNRAPFATSDISLTE